MHNNNQTFVFFLGCLLCGCVSLGGVVHQKLTLEDVCETNVITVDIWAEPHYPEKGIVIPYVAKGKNPFLGSTICDGLLLSGFDKEEGAFQKAGLRSWDIVTHINGERVVSRPQFLRRLIASPVDIPSI